MQHHQPIRRKQAIARAHDSLVPAAQVPAPSVNPSPALATEQGSPVGHDVGNISIYSPGGEIGPEGGATVPGRAPLAVQRDAPGLPPVPDVALTPPSLLQPPAPTFAPAPDPSLQVHLDPQAEVAVQQVDQALAPTNVKSALVNLRLGSATTPPPPADPLTSPAPTPPAASPAVPAGAGPATAHEAGAGDLMDAVMAVPAVDAAITDLRMRATDRVRADWGHLPTGERAVTISAVAVIGAGVLAGAVSDPDARQILLTQLNGKVLPVPGVDWLHVEIGTRPDNLMLGLHVDVGALLPSSLGFGSSSPSAIGGPPPTADPLAPTQRSVQRSVGDDRLPGVAPPGNRALSASAASRAGFDLGAISIYPPVVQRAEAGTGSAAGGGSADDDHLARRIQAASATGTTIDGAVQRRLEGGLGADLTGVRVHTGGEADSLARSVNAVAFTTGPDIFFRAGAYQPQSSEGMHLLAHEAAHTVQQAAGPVAGTPAPGGVSISDPANSDEQAAGRAADAVTVGQIAQEDAGNGQSTANAPVQRSVGSVRTEQPQRGTARSSGDERDFRIQRVPDPETAKRLDKADRDNAINKKKNEALRIDARWHGAFNERIASYEGAILRITGGLDAAEKGFQAAQVAQAQFDQMKVQLIGAALSIGFAAGFEWVIGGALGAVGKKLGKTEKQIEDFVEWLENPANTVVSSAVNNVGAYTAKKSAEEGQLPAVGGGALQFLTSNSQALKAHLQAFEAAYVKRSDGMKGATDDQWEALNLATWEAKYQAALADLNDSFSGVEEMKPDAEVAQILERHLWALWLQGQGQAELKEKQGAIASGDQRRQATAMGTEPEYSVGSYIEDALTKVGIAKIKSLKLSGHWYEGNSPGNWKALLLEWARGYNETLKKQ